MQIMSLSVPIAPQTTGHPFGLPENRDPVRRETRVTPVAESRNPDAGFKDGKKPLQFWRSAGGAVDPETHIAPPSIMQIKISQLLNEQAGLTRPDEAGDEPRGDKHDRSLHPAPQETEDVAPAPDRTAPGEDPRRGYANAAQITKADTARDTEDS